MRRKKGYVSVDDWIHSENKLLEDAKHEPLLICEKCTEDPMDGIYRKHEFAEKRKILETEKGTGLFYRCRTCGHERMWGKEW